MGSNPSVRIDSRQGVSSSWISSLLCLPELEFVVVRNPRRAPVDLVLVLAQFVADGPPQRAGKTSSSGLAARVRRCRRARCHSRLRPRRAACTARSSRSTSRPTALAGSFRGTEVWLDGQKVGPRQARRFSAAHRSSTGPARTQRSPCSTTRVRTSASTPRVEFVRQRASSATRSSL